MKGYAALIITALMLFFAWGAPAQEMMELYVQEGCMEEAKVRQVLSLLGGDGTPWTLTKSGLDLKELVLSGDIPDLAICSPAEMQPWAKEEMLLPLQMHISDQQRMQRQVLGLCVHEENLLMAPLIAHHRQMAVNTALMEEAGLGYMLDRQAYPVWYPAQFYQIMEEFLLRDRITLDVWRAQMASSAPIEALTQAIYGGMLLSEDGSACTANSMNMRAGVQWLSDVIDDGMVGYCRTQEEALSRFLAGETAIYIDWTDALEKRLADFIREKEIKLIRTPYPAAVGLPVRSFELVGVCAFAGGDAARDARLVQACARLHEAAQDLFGARGIWQDGAVWPSSLSCDTGATLRSLFCTALEEVIEGSESVQSAFYRLQAAMDALERTK